MTGGLRIVETRLLLPSCKHHHPLPNPPSHPHPSRSCRCHRFSCGQLLIPAAVLREQDGTPGQRSMSTVSSVKAGATPQITPPLPSVPLVDPIVGVRYSCCVVCEGTSSFVLRFRVIQPSMKGDLFVREGHLLMKTWKKRYVELTNYHVVVFDSARERELVRCCQSITCGVENVVVTFVVGRVAHLYLPSHSLPQWD
jgi:hypothetical protein